MIEIGSSSLQSNERWLVMEGSKVPDDCDVGDSVMNLM